MPKGHKLQFSKEQLAKIGELYNSGLTVQEVAERFGVSYTGMRNAMISAKIERRHPNRKYRIDEHVFDAIDNESAAYHLGLLYADGNVRKSKTNVQFTSKDLCLVQELAFCMSSTAPIEHRETYYRLSVSGIHLSERLRELGILPQRPDHTLATSQVAPAVLHHFLRGFFDGDGSATRQKMIWFCGRKTFMVFIRQTLAEQAGRNPDITIMKHSKSRIYYLRYKGGRNARAVADYLYQDATIFLPRKRAVIDAWPPLISRSEQSRKGWITRKKNGAA